MSIVTQQEIRDFRDRLSSRSDKFQEAFIDSIYDNLPEVFDAEVVSINIPEDSEGTEIIVGDTRYILLRVRPQGITNFIYPDPFSSSCEDIRRKLINMHPQCMIDAENVPTTSDLVECRRIKESNGQRGVLVSNKISRRNSRFIDVASERASAVNAFRNTAPALVSSNSSAAPYPPKQSAKEASNVYTLQNYKDFAVALMPLLDDIASHEAGSAGYNAFNCGNADGGETCPTTVINEFTGKLATKTIKQIQDSQNQRTIGGTEGLFAVGRYQLITSTLQGAVANLADLKPTDIFNKTTQDPLGAYLCLSGKKKYLHGFLIDKHDDAERAAHELAEEWASYPSQYTYIRRNGKQTTRGKSVYSNDSAGNAARAGETPERVVDFMIRVKRQFLNNTKTKEILGI